MRDNIVLLKICLRLFWVSQNKRNTISVHPLRGNLSPTLFPRCNFAESAYVSSLITAIIVTCNPFCWQSLKESNARWGLIWIKLARTAIGWYYVALMMSAMHLLVSLDRFVWRWWCCPRSPAGAQGPAAPAGAVSGLPIPAVAGPVSGSGAPTCPGAHLCAWSGAQSGCGATQGLERQSDLPLPLGPLPLHV